MAEEKKQGSAKVAVVYYSMYGHIKAMAERVAKGAQATGATVKIFQVAETLPAEVLAKMHAPAKSDLYPVVTPNDLVEYDAIIFGFPTRFGAMPAQVRAFWDSTGGIWQTGGYVGKFISFFFSTATQGGGQETTALSSYTAAVHHGMLIVPIGYTDPSLFNMDEIHGGSAYGAGTLAKGDGSRQPSNLELGVAEHQGKLVANYANTFVDGKAKKAAPAPQ